MIRLSRRPHTLAGNTDLHDRDRWFWRTPQNIPHNSHKLELHKHKHIYRRTRCQIDYILQHRLCCSTRRLRQFLEYSRLRRLLSTVE